MFAQETSEGSTFLLGLSTGEFVFAVVMAFLILFMLFKNRGVPIEPGRVSGAHSNQVNDGLQHVVHLAQGTQHGVAAARAQANYRSTRSHQQLAAELQQLNSAVASDPSAPRGLYDTVNGLHRNLPRD